MNQTLPATTDTHPPDSAETSSQTQAISVSYPTGEYRTTCNTHADLDVDVNSDFVGRLQKVRFSE